MSLSLFPECQYKSPLSAFCSTVATFQSTLVCSRKGTPDRTLLKGAILVVNFGMKKEVRFASGMHKHVCFTSCLLGADHELIFDDQLTSVWLFCRLPYCILPSRAVQYDWLFMHAHTTTPVFAA